MDSFKNILASVMLALLILGLAAGTASAAEAPDLGTADNFAVLAGTDVANTGTTVVNGNLGVSPGGTVTGSPTVFGTIHLANATALQAQNDTTTAYNNLTGQTCTNSSAPADLAGQTLVPGVYCYPATSAQISSGGILTLDALGNNNAVWVFKIGTTLTTISGASVVLINGSQDRNVFWQVGSSAILGTTTNFVGTIIAADDITLNTGANVSGRVLARGVTNDGKVTLDTNTITVPPTFNLSGYKNDTNGTGLPNWNITLYNATTSAFIAFNLTNVSGFYEFQNLAPGIYNLTEVMQSGWKNVTSISQNVTLSSSDKTNQNFTNQQLFNLSGYKNDTHGSGLPDWNITLYNSTTSAFIAFNLTSPVNL